MPGRSAPTRCVAAIVVVHVMRPLVLRLKNRLFLRIQSSGFFRSFHANLEFPELNQATRSGSAMGAATPPFLTTLTRESGIINTKEKFHDANTVHLNFRGMLRADENYESTRCAVS